MAKSIASLDELMEEAAAERERVSLGAILQVVGRRSFGPLILVAGLIALAPVIGDIPGVPTTVGLFVLLVAGQLVLHRDHFWLPRWMLRRSVAREKLCKALGWLRPPGTVRRPAPEAAPDDVHARHGDLRHGGPVHRHRCRDAHHGGHSRGGQRRRGGAHRLLAMIVHDGLLALAGFAFTAATMGVVLWGLL